MDFDYHVVILNINEKVRRIVSEIMIGTAPQTPKIVVMVQDRQLWNANPNWHPPDDDQVVITDGCPAEPRDLERIRIDRATAAVILADPRQGRLADAHSTLVAVAVERRNPQVHTVIELISSVNRVHLRSTEVNEVICLGEITEKLIAQSCITPGIHRVFWSLLAAHAETSQIFILQVPEAYIGLSYRQVVRSLIERGHSFVVCGFSLRRKMIEGEPGLSSPAQTFALNPRAGVEPGKDTILESGDRLVVISRRRPELLC